MPLAEAPPSAAAADANPSSTPAAAGPEPASPGNGNGSAAAVPVATAAAPPESAAQAKIKGLLARLGELRDDWLYLVEDHLEVVAAATATAAAAAAATDSETSSSDTASGGAAAAAADASTARRRKRKPADDVRATLHKYGRHPDERKRASVQVMQMPARMDLARAPFGGAGSTARFNVGKFVEDLHNDETITITRTKTYVQPGDDVDDFEF